MNREFCGSVPLSALSFISVPCQISVVCPEPVIQVKDLILNTNNYLRKTCLYHCNIMIDKSKILNSTTRLSNCFNFLIVEGSSFANPNIRFHRICEKLLFYFLGI